MPGIFVHPREVHDARISLNASGVEFLAWSAVLDRRMNIRFSGTDRPFPTEGFVRLRRGADFTGDGQRIVDAFRYDAGYEDSDKGEAVAEKWSVYLQIEEGAFDRLVQRLQWGLPELSLSFDVSNEVLTFAPGPDWEDLYFSPDPRPWVAIIEAHLGQRPFPAG